MKMRLLKAAGKITAVGFLAVFFSSAVLGTDSSLFRLENGLSELIYQLSRSVVTVEASTQVSPQLSADPGNGAVQNLISSGIIYDLQGHILVSALGVAGRERIVVRFGDEVFPAQLRGIDHLTGLAVIFINKKIGVPASLGDREGCAGQMVIAMGNVFGVKACPSLGFCAGSRPDGTIQFSAPITAGTVGGGLFDLSGNLIGLITGGLGYETRPEVGVAVPAYRIPDIVRHLVLQGDRPVGYIGVKTTNIEITPGIELTPPNMLANVRTGQSQVIDKGVMVIAVVPFSPAAKAGLKKGDLLVSMNDSPLRSALDLRNRVRQSLPGSTIELGFFRRNTRYDARLEVGQLPLVSSQRLPTQTAGQFSRLQSQDSFRQQIDSLKKALLHLEKQLEGLR